MLLILSRWKLKLILIFIAVCTISFLYHHVTSHDCTDCEAISDINRSHNVSGKLTTNYTEEQLKISNVTSLGNLTATHGDGDIVEDDIYWSDSIERLLPVGELIFVLADHVHSEGLV